MGQATQDLYPVFIKLPVAQIVTLKFILETYEGLGIVRTLDPERGEIVILCPADTAATVKELLASLAEELQLRIIPPPASLDGDWLLTGEKEFIRY